MSESVIILGAGASKEIDLPIGSELIETIAKRLDYEIDHIGRSTRGDHRIVDALRSFASQNDLNKEELRELNAACPHIVKAMPLAFSIDNFIDAQTNKYVPLCGKMAIINSILEAEANSRLYFSQNDNEQHPSFNKLQGTWYVKLFNLLTSNCKFDEIAERLKRTTFIIFNYDRCLENFLYTALQAYYQETPDKVADVLKDLKVYHPYGVVGDHPWSNRGNIPNFGNGLHHEQLLKRVEMIKTFTESHDEEDSEIAAIKASIQNARTLVFLGFAFHKQNMELLKPKGISKVMKVFATAHGFSKSDQEDINNQIHGLIGGNHREENEKRQMKINVGAYKCHELFDEFSRSLHLFF